MLIFPAIDLYEGKAVRLYKGDYAQKTVYGENPLDFAYDFEKEGATQIHLVDLEGAKSGGTPNFDVICKIKRNSSLFCEVGGGIRSMEVIEKYLFSGIDRVILGTAALENPGFLKEALTEFREKIAVGVDVKDGFVAVRGWTEKSEKDAFGFCSEMEKAGVSTIICTDISKDGAMQGANRELYGKLSEKFGLNITASGGVSTLDDVRALKNLGLYGAIIGKAYYTKAISLKEAIEVAK